MILSVNQWRIVRHDGNLLVTSVPGAGKTRVVEAKAIQEAARVIGTPRRVACLTYTNAAAQELARRVLPSLRDEAREALFIGTVHSFCINEVISPHAERLPELAHGHDVATPEHPVAEAIIAHIIQREPTAKDLNNFSEVARDAHGQPVPHPSLSQDDIQLYWDCLLEHGLIDFSGVLFYSAIMLERYPDTAAAIGASFSWILVDEYQDTSVAQLRILRNLVVGGNFPRWLLIGDFNQSIFSFNGVNREHLHDFAAYINARAPILKTTYRCSPAVVDQALKLISAPTMRSHNQEPPGEIFEIHGGVERTVRDFVCLIRERELPYHRCAIVAPARWALMSAIDGLNSLDNPVPWSPQFRFPGLTSVAQCIADIAACAYDQHHADHMSTASMSVTNFVRESTGFMPDTDAIDRAILRCVGDFKYAHNYTLQDACSIVQKHVGDAISPYVRAAFDHAVEIAIRPKILEHSPLKYWRGATIARIACTHESLALATIHGAKGLEFDAVLLAAFEEGVIPHQNPDDMSEELRKAYVAVTRARVLLAYGFRTGRASRFWRKANSLVT